jgi:hypothetical protein
MTFEEIAQSITPIGYAAAIIGLLLCLLVIIVRFRARNLAGEKAYQAAVADQERAENPAPQDAAPGAEPEKPKTPFKAYVPEESTPE